MTARRFWLVSASLLVLARAALWLAYAATPVVRGPVSDSWLYLTLAREWNATGRWGLEAAFHSPLYPYLVAFSLRLPGESHVPLLLAQNAVGIGASLLVLAWVRRTARAVWAPWAALALLVASGAWFALEWRLFPETFATGAQLALLHAADRSLARRGARAWMVAAGALLGLLALLRPNYLLLVPVFAGYAAWRARRGRASPAVALLWLVLPALLVAPFLVRNHALGAGWSLAANAGITFHQGNNAAATGGYARVAGVSADVTRQNVDAALLATGGRPRSVPQANRFWWRRGLSWLAGHPGDALVLLGRKALLLLAPVETGGDIPFAFEKHRVPLLHVFGFASFTLLVALALAGALARAPLPAPRFLFLAALAVPLVTCLVFYVMARYRLPAWPLLVAMALPGLEAALGARSLSPIRAWAARGLVGLGVVATVLGAALPLTPSTRVAGWHNWGVAWQHAGETKRAIAAYAEVDAVQPGHRETLENLSQAFLALGNMHRASDVLRDLLDRYPDSFVGWHGLATLHLFRQEWEDAAAAARRALALRSEEPATWLVLAEASVRLDRTAQACEALAHIPRIPPRYAHLARLKEECAGGR